MTCVSRKFKELRPKTTGAQALDLFVGENG
jgi:hypothetical protein